MKKLLVLGAAEFQIPLYIQAKKMGIYTCAVDINENAKAFKYADEYRICSVKDVERIFEIANLFGPDGITAGMVDVAVNTVANVTHRLGLPGLSPDIAERASNKLLMIEAFKEANVPHPGFFYLDSNTSLDNINIPIPSIVKPIDMAGSRGINHIDSLEHAKGAIDDSIKKSDTGRVILEEFMIGSEVSVEIIVKEDRPYVMQITDKLTSGIPHFMELGHSQPSRFSSDIKKQICAVACAAVKSLELVNCIVHAELIITESGPKMVELGARMGGDSIHQYLIEYSTGINMQEIAIKIALGEDFAVPKSTTSKAAAIRFIQSKSGTVKKVVFDEKQLRKAKKVEIYCKPGDVYEIASDNSDRMGYVITQADAVEKAICDCERIVKSIEIEME